jgi:predicted AAA+ superfamily ATPase
LRIFHKIAEILNKNEPGVIFTIKREKYLTEIRGFYDSDLIKIITGVRRCGKSVVLEQVMDEIRKKQ